MPNRVIWYRMASTASVRYREATRDDVADVRSVARAAWERDYPDVVNREATTDTVEEWYDADQLAGDVEREDALVVVATVEEDVVGFVHAIVDDDCGTVLRAYVHPDARGDGVGRGLVDATVDRFRARGCERAEAMVLARNEPGNAFYDAIGFEHVATDTTIVGGDGYDERVYLRYL